jgi:hypothetical protein
MMSTKKHNAEKQADIKAVMAAEAQREDVRAFLSGFRGHVDYWASLPIELLAGSPTTAEDATKKRLEGLAFSILVMLDGTEVPKLAHAELHALFYKNPTAA